MTQSKLRGKVGVLLAGTLVVAMADENCSSIARWTQLSHHHAIGSPQCPSVRSSMGFAEYNSKLYVFGGSDYTKRPTFYLGDLHAYDTSTGTWTDLSFPQDGVAPIARDQMGFAASSGKLYVFGGYGPVQYIGRGQIGCSRWKIDLHEYDIALFSWKDLSSPAAGTPPRTGRSCDGLAGMGFAASSGRLYVFSGYNGYEVANGLHEYHIAFRTWTNLSSPNAGTPPSPRESMGMTAFNGKLYVFGGVTSSRRVADLHEYNIALRVWRDLSDLNGGSPPADRSNFGFAATNGKLYVFGGAVRTTSPENDLHEYDIDLQKWKDLSSMTVGILPSPRTGVGFAESGGNIFLFGGQILNDTYRLSFECDVDECEGSLHVCSTHAACINTPGSFKCACDTGWETSDGGLHCSNEDECLTSNGGCSQICADTVGSRICACSAGYSLNADGVTCDDIDECASREENKCHESAGCFNTVGGYECVCFAGFRGDGFTCISVSHIDVSGTPAETSQQGPLVTAMTMEASTIPADVSTPWPGGVTSAQNLSTTESLIRSTPVAGTRNMCETGENICHLHATCTASDTGAGYTCTCQTGYAGDGVQCAEDTQALVSFNATLATSLEQFIASEHAKFTAAVAYIAGVLPEHVVTGTVQAQAASGAKVLVPTVVHVWEQQAAEVTGSLLAHLDAALAQHGILLLSLVFEPNATQPDPEAPPQHGAADSESSLRSAAFVAGLVSGCLGAVALAAVGVWVCVRSRLRQHQHQHQHPGPAAAPVVQDRLQPRWWRPGTEDDDYEGLDRAGEELHVTMRSLSRARIIQRAEPAIDAPSAPAWHELSTLDAAQALPRGLAQEVSCAEVHVLENPRARGA